MSQPLYALSLFLHISATLFWVGGLLIMVVLVWPEVRRVLEQTPALYQLLARLRRRFYPISNLCLATLIVTGLFQMTADPYYDGFLTFDNEWSRVMLIKHALIVLMALCGWWLQYGVIPALERASILAERGKADPDQWRILRRRELRLTRLNAILGLVVVALSAWAGSL